jgi:hypothetical protein
MHRGLPCLDETTGSGSTIPTFGPEPTEDSSSPEACSATLTSSKAGITREYDTLQHDAMTNIMLDNNMLGLTT